MSPSKQNLFVFLEENEYQPLIDRKLVKLYVNRCVIDENANFEITGVYELQKVTDPMCNHLNPLFNANAGQRAKKEAVDGDIFSAALEEASVSETNSTDNHFIIGSLFHSVLINRLDKLPINLKLLDWLRNELKSQGMRSLYITLLTGNRNNLITKEMHKIAYDGKFPSYLATFGIWEESVRYPSKISVNDDFELSIKLIRQGRRLQQIIPLFLLPMLNSNQLKLMRTKDESFLESFVNHHIAHKVTHAQVDVSELELKYFPDSDPSSRYVNCFCLRQSYHLKSS